MTEGFSGAGRPLATKAEQTKTEKQEAQAAAVAAKIKRYVKRDPTDLDRALADLPLTDIGNGQRLLARHGDDILIVPQLKEGWFGFNGVIWERDEDGLKARAAAHATASDVMVETQALLNDGVVPPQRVAEHFAHAERSGTSGRCASMLSVIAPSVRRDVQDLDGRLDSITCRNVTLDLGSRKDPSAVTARAHARDDLATRMALADWDEDAVCPDFEKFMMRVQPDTEIRSFLQRWFGLCLTGRPTQHLLLFYGEGANGKSTLLNILRGVMGTYAMTIGFNSLTDDAIRGGGDATPDLARLPGARLVMASEPKVGTQLSESLIKTQTGGEPMVVRPMFVEPFEFVPSHKLVLSFNNKPVVRATDHGTWRRLLMVPWTEIIPDDEQEVGFAERIIETEGPGVLRWLVDGFKEYGELGLSVPDKVKAATDDYRHENDPVGDFIDTCTEPVGEGEHHSLQAKELWTCWQRYCDRNGIEVGSLTKFGIALTAPGRKYRKEKIGGVVLYFGRRWSEAGRMLMGEMPGEDG